MQHILETLHPTLNSDKRLSGLQIWTSFLETELSELSESTVDQPTEAAREFRDRHASIIAELLLSTPDHPRPCPFLEVFRSQASDQSTLMKQYGLVEKLVGSFAEVFGATGEIRSADKSLLGQLGNRAGLSLRGVELRCATLQLAWLAMGEKNQNSTLRNCIKHLITAYREYFSTNCWTKIPALSVFRCVGFHRLAYIASRRGQSSESNTNAARAIVDAFEQCSIETHRDPATAFVCDTFALALGYPSESAESLGSSWRPGDTWVLLGATDSTACSGTGMVLRLRTERSKLVLEPAQHGELCPGVFYPDPRLAAHCQIDEDFQTGVRNAWITTLHQTAKSGCSHDFRWQVAAIDRSENHEQRRIIGISGLNGDSATLAYAAALRSCEEDKLLRQDTASTATFEIEVPSKGPASKPSADDSKYSNPRLGVVGLVADKAKAALGKSLDPMQLSELWRHAQPAFANKIKRILVASEQPLEFPPDIEPVRVSEWDVVWRELNEAEAIISDFVMRSASRWDQIRRSQSKESAKDLIDLRLNNVHRLDLYVPPEFQWEDPNPKCLEGRVANEAPWITTKLNGTRQDQLISALQFAVKSNRGLVLLNGAGAGKTVTSFKLQQLLSQPATFESIFGDGLPRLLFHWSSKLPSASALDEPLLPVLASDPDLLQVISDSAKANNSTSNIVAEAELLVRYALAEKRVVVIVDAFDELKGDQRETIKSAFEESLKLSNVLWIFTGRDYAINNESGRGRMFQSDAFRRLRICPFNKELQNEYMALALPGVQWRESLQDAYDNWDELLGLPHTLREIVRIFQLSGDAKALPRFESPSDLFLQCSHKMLEREFGDKKIPQLIIDGEEVPINTCLGILERALGAIAFQMACMGIWKEVSGTRNEVERKINDVMKESKARFCKSLEEDGYDYDVEACWDWAKRILNQFELLNGASQADIGARVLSFSTRRVQEMRVARYLTTYATEEDLTGTGNKPCALGHNGDPAWDNIWKAAIRMPHLIVDPQRYRSAITQLFQRPIDKSKQRRPTELMWIADRWIRRKPELSGFQIDLRVRLGEQFEIEHDRIMQSGTEDQKRALQELMDPESYLFLADPKHRVDEYDTGKYEMGKSGSKVSVKLSPFGICKWILSNAQFQLFDDNFVAVKLVDLLIPNGKKHDDRLKDYQGADQPASFLSWYDSYWYAGYIASGLKQVGREINQHGRSWGFKLLSDAQFEYAARAGGKGDYFRDQRGLEVSTKNLAQFAHFGREYETGATISVKSKEPNAWGIHQSSGNLWKWVYDQYAEQLVGGANPLQADDDRLGSFRVVRGGSWRYGAADCESALRGGDDPSDRWFDYGMVLALSPSESPSKASAVESK